MTTDDWEALEKRVWEKAVRHLHSPLVEACIPPEYDLLKQPKRSWAELFRNLTGDPHFSGPVKVLVQRNEKTYELLFTTEELDAIHYGELPNVCFIGEDPDFKMIVRTAKNHLGRKRGCYVPATYPIYREMFDELTGEHDT